MSRGMLESNYVDDNDMFDDGQGLSSQNMANVKGLEEMTLDEDEEDMGFDGEDMGFEGEDMGFDELVDLNMNTITPSDVKTLEFANPHVAYLFYNEYGRINEFLVRKHKVGRNNNKDILWQTFVCSSHGFRDMKYVNMPNWKREHRPLTRFGCKAKMRIRVDVKSGQWYVASFANDHNHQLVGEKFAGFLRSHRKMSDADIAHFNSMRRSGISTSKIYGSFANVSGGFDKIGFCIKDLYNQIEKQRKVQDCDAQEAVKYLRGLQSTDPMFYWSHKVDGDGDLLHLLWCDGSSRVDYEVFGDVLAFDATYRKNKYRCQLVVFSRVNHHKQTCVFSSAIVSDETEETYVWLLQEFLQAMKGKCPKCVITDGDNAMRNAIRNVFPEAHHRLCGWHLLRNATANVGKPRFTQLFKTCMLSDYEVNEFQERWDAMVEECGVQNHPWVQQLFERKMMWATAHIKGKFFACLRTTSRFEALHAQVGKYVQSSYNLTEFLHHFQRCLEYLRNNEVEADFKSSYGQLVMQTPLVAL